VVVRARWSGGVPAVAIARVISQLTQILQGEVADEATADAGALGIDPYSTNDVIPLNGKRAVMERESEGMRSDFPVAISGGGPVGMALAIDLALRGSP